MNIFDKGIKNIKSENEDKIINYFKQEYNNDCLNNKPKSPIYEYLRAIISSNFNINLKYKIKYSSFEDEKGKKNFIIHVNSESMDDYTKNLEKLKENLLNDNYSIPVSFKSDQTNKSSKSQKLDDKFENKIKYNYNIELSNSSQNTTIQVESFISNEMKDKIKCNVINNIIKKDKKEMQHIIENIIEKDCNVIKLTTDNRIKDLFNNYTIKVTKEFNKNDFTDFFKQLILDEQNISFLLNLIIDVNKINENTVNMLQLYYNILLFNFIIDKDKYNKIKDDLKNSIKVETFINKKISEFYFIKVFNCIDDFINYFIITNKNLNNLKNYNQTFASIIDLENNLDQLLKIFAPFCLLFKVVEFFLSEFINTINIKSEKVSNYLDGFCLEDEIKYIISIENPNITQIPNIFYILLEKEITFFEFDLICLLKQGEKLIFTKPI